MIVKYKGNQSIELPEGSNAKALAEIVKLRAPHEAIAACINGKTVDLGTILCHGDEVNFWNFEDPQGKEVYWHTSAHVLAQAVLRIWPDAKPTIGPPIENGFYYDFANLRISDADFAKIEKEMQSIISANYFSQREELASKKDALRIFADNPYKCELIHGFEEGSTLSAYPRRVF